MKAVIPQQDGSSPGKMVFFQKKFQKLTKKCGLRRILSVSGFEGFGGKSDDNFSGIFAFEKIVLVIPKKEQFT